MMRRLIALLLLACALAASPAAHAGPCVSVVSHGDRWTGQDKQLHLLGGAFWGSIGAAAYGNVSDGVLLGTGVGIFKELVMDRPDPNSTCSAKDAIVTFFGSVIGAFGQHWIVTPRSVTWWKVY